jgi:hypothetical protein
VGVALEKADELIFCDPYTSISRLVPQQSVDLDKKSSQSCKIS